MTSIIGELKGHPCGARFINYETGVMPDIAEGVGISGVIDCSEKVTIEKDAFSGHDIMILTNQHDYTKFGYERKLSSKKAPVYIKEGAWLCSRCVILPGVTVGRNSVVGAGSIVTKDIPDYQLWAGVPCKFIKNIPH